MNIHLKKACLEIDEALFNDDILFNAEVNNEFWKYLDRWLRHLPRMPVVPEKILQVDGDGWNLEDGTFFIWKKDAYKAMLNLQSQCGFPHDTIKINRSIASAKIYEVVPYDDNNRQAVHLNGEASYISAPNDLTVDFNNPRIYETNNSDYAMINHEATAENKTGTGHTIVKSIQIQEAYPEF